ncbi:MAG: hypothetical protein KGI33_12330 [Thaumarchaeota archaeon]|nr:hypothetical protein [Nitrososphaerota archaeon]
MAWKPGKDLLQWIPGLAFIYAFYEYYADRGLDGIQKDLSAITIDGLKAKFTQILIGIAVIIGVDTLAKHIKQPYLRVGIRALGYYVGAKQLATALKQGAGYRGGMGRSSLPPAGLRQAANPYMR